MGWMLDLFFGKKEEKEPLQTYMITVTKSDGSTFSAYFEAKSREDALRQAKVYYEVIKGARFSCES